MAASASATVQPLEEKNAGSEVLVQSDASEHLMRLLETRWHVPRMYVEVDDKRNAKKGSKKK